MKGKQHGLCLLPLLICVAGLIAINKDYQNICKALAMSGMIAPDLPVVMQELHMYS